MENGLENGIIGVLLGGWMVSMLGVILIYVYFGYCFFRMAKKVGLPNGWWGFVPVLNLLLMVQIAGKDWWWILLFFIPLANIVFMVLIWMAIAERLKKPNWYGILMIVPIANFIIPGLLAFRD